MQAKFTRESDFRLERDFGAKIGATFEFLGAHWRPLGKCLLYFVLPLTLVMGVAVGISQSQMWGQLDQASATASPADRFSQLSQFNGFGTSYWLGMLAMLLSYVVLGATVYSYVRVRMALEPTQEVTPQLVWQEIRRHSPRMLLSTVLVIIISLIGFVLLFIPGIYLGVALSLVWAIQVFEDQGSDSSIRRSLNLMSGKWWSTFGLTFVMSLIIGLLGAILQVPQYVAIIGKVMHWSWLGSDALMLAANIVASVARMLLYTPLLLAIMFQYFNLVERKEGVGLRTLVDSLGTGPAPVAHNHAFRPDEEGEY
ncbi:hypothetical protein KBK19_07300 [Microvirga sp. STR05]|uniref:Glycerophosphoryl diester phosphodiesterase membrane domain-containing protein n=1 Tax=Hymenobacter duratus TaxID=2771356 RepID=A0ABR8JGG8_9BACT|nr:hypothetical protein [Hymenobacter duratus]MBD2714836.1 hypothetical protein [Hymenobacter duratus]MBR7949741.1 hypothetical protein [Microvirga sp. STR05]